jgi:hypothetical protein
MSGIQFADIDDAVLLTMENYIKKGAFLDLQTDITDHVAVREIWKNRQKKFDGGNDWTFQAQIATNGSTRAVGLFETDGTALSDTMIEGSMSPRHINACYIYDQREKAFQQGGKAIADLVQTRYTAMMVDFYDYLEAVLWGCPAASDTKTPHGVSYWVTKGTAGQEGFYGMDPTGYTSVGRGHILSSAQARWRSWFADYAEVTDTDLIAKIDTAMMSTQFRSPVDHAQPDLASAKTGIYANQGTAKQLKALLRTQNMNLGNDLIGVLPLIKGVAPTYVPKLDADTSDPVYILDWKWMAVGVLAGWENNLSAPYMVPNKSKVRRVDLDCTLELVCTNLRKQMCFAKV